MKLTAKLDASTKTNGSTLIESFLFTEHQGMLNVTYSAIGGGADPKFMCWRFTDRRQGNALYIALRRLGATAVSKDCLEDEGVQESGLRFARNVMRQEGVQPFNEVLASLIISGYVQAA